MSRIFYKKIFLSFFTFILVFLLSPNSPVFAQASASNQQECEQQKEAIFTSCLSAAGESSAEVESECIDRADDLFQNCLRIADTPPGEIPEGNPLLKYQASINELNKIKANTTQEFIGLVIKTATGIMGTIALAMMLYGGALWMTARGNSSQIDKAQNVIFYGALGIFVIFGSYALITYIFQERHKK